MSTAPPADTPEAPTWTAPRLEVHPADEAAAGGGAAIEGLGSEPIS